MSTAVTPLPHQISLFFKEGTSDKEYHVQIVGNEADGYMVNYQFGKRGSKLQSRAKTKAPVDLAKALEIYNDMVNAQLRDGYQPMNSTGSGYQMPVNDKKKLGLMPQLLNFIELDEALKLINDDAWVMQEKKDGVRCMIKKHKKTIEGGNKKGEVTSLPISVVNAVKMVCGEADASLDGELVGEMYWLFDMLSIGVHAFADKTYRERLQAINEWLFTDNLIAISDWDENIQLVPTAVGKASKKVLFEKLKKENAEGVVFKRLDSVYKPGRPHSGGNQLKYKFKASATVRVKALNNNKQSFQMEMMKEGDWVYVGDCTYYPTKYTPKAGDYAEVEYLYAYPGGALFQPVCLGKRTDVDDSDCGISQLKYKQGSQEEDEN